ncbi:MAG: hypothetical protein NTZ73_00290 [Candidatus Diapherotrites archaeon]|nr:hypothetical protein [Candidatus Diapherotrites archaeon]
MPKMSLSEAVSIKAKEMDRYHQQILLCLGLLFFFEKNKSLGMFVGAEIDLKYALNSVQKCVRPDVIIQAWKKDGKLFGIPIEIKLSVDYDIEIKKELNEMKRYDNQLSGWKEFEGLTPDDHVIVYAPNGLDSGKVKRVLEQELKSGNIKFNREFCIWEWQTVTSQKYGKGDVLLIKQIFGDLHGMCDSLNKQLTDGIPIDYESEEFAKKREGAVFTRKKPPKEYMMVWLWTNVLQQSVDSSSNITLDELTKKVNQFYKSELMNNNDGQSFFIKKDWIREAMDWFCKIKLCKESSETCYNIVMNKKIRNISKFICTQVAKKEKLRKINTDTNQMALETFTQGS